MTADLRRILVACRGELAQRLVALYHSLGIEVVVAFSAAEPDAPYLEDADYEGHSLSMLQRIGEALHRRIEIRFVPEVA